MSKTSVVPEMYYTHVDKSVSVCTLVKQHMGLSITVCMCVCVYMFAGIVGIAMPTGRLLVRMK